MAQVTIRVPNADMADVLAALEQAWGTEVVRLPVVYKDLTPAEKAGACLAVYLRQLTKQHRRAAEVKRRREAEQPIVITEPDIG